jgi:hypothetical protein
LPDIGPLKTRLRLMNRPCRASMPDLRSCWSPGKFGFTPSGETMMLNNSNMRSCEPDQDRLIPWDFTGFPFRNPERVEKGAIRSGESRRSEAPPPAFPSPPRLRGRGCPGRGGRGGSEALSFHFSIYTAISCAPLGRLVRPLGGQGTGLAKRRIDDHAPIGGAGAPPSQRPNYFRIDLEMESEDRENRKVCGFAAGTTPSPGPAGPPSPAKRGWDREGDACVAPTGIAPGEGKASAGAPFVPA